MPASYLYSQKAATKSNQSRLEVIGEVDEMAIVPAKTVLCESAARYCTLHQALQKSEPLEPRFVNDYAPADAKRQYDYVKELILPYKCVQYTYTGSKNHLHFLWHVSLDTGESETLQQSMKVCDELKKSFPVYHSRAMHRELNSFFWDSDPLKTSIPERSLSTTDWRQFSKLKCCTEQEVDA